MLNKFSEIIKFVEKKDKIKLYIIQIQIILISFLEIISLTLIIPFIKLASEEKTIDEINFLKYSYDYFAFETHSSFTVFCGFFLILIFGFSTFFTLRVRYNIVSFSQNLSAYLANKLFNNILNKDYNFFINTPLSKIIRILTEETSRLVSGVIFPALVIVSKSFLILFIFIVLINQNFKITIFFLSIFFMIYFFLYKILKKKISLFGNQLSILGTAKIKFIDDIYNSIKAIKIFNKEKYYHEKFANISNEVARIYSFVNVASIFPRYLIDFIGFSIAILSTLFLIIFSNQDLLNTFSLLAFYSLAAYRLIPAFQEIYSSLLQIKNNSVSISLINEITRDLTLRKNLLSDETFFLQFEKKILFNNITFKYQNSDKYLFKSLNFELNKNENLAIIGQTGSGKSSILDIIMGLNIPESIDLYIDNQNINLKDHSKLFHLYSYVPQNILLLNNSILENICFGEEHSSINQDRLNLAIDISLIREVINNSSQGLNTIIGDKGSTLSGGQIQRIGIARAIYFNRPIIVFDESTNSLDFETESNIIKSLLSLENKTIIFVTHNIQNIHLFDRLCVFKNNKISYFGDPNKFEKDKHF